VCVCVYVHAREGGKQGEERRGEEQAQISEQMIVIWCVCALHESVLLPLFVVAKLLEGGVPRVVLVVKRGVPPIMGVHFGLYNILVLVENHIKSLDAFY
jgi:hypothetical protein